jgi:hypothetical protein
MCDQVARLCAASQEGITDGDTLSHKVYKTIVLFKQTALPVYFKIVQ